MLAVINNTAINRTIMSNHKKFKNTRILNSFVRRINCLHDTVHSESPSAKDLLCTLITLYTIKGLSRVVIKGFTKDWENASCNITCDGDCGLVLNKAVSLKNKLVDSHLKLSTMNSSLARWAGRRLTGPVLDWNDLILDLSIASDPQIQSSLCELEEVL